MAQHERRTLLSSSARVQVPWIKVTIGKYTFGVYSVSDPQRRLDDDGHFFDAINVQYPNYVQSLDIVKVNGQINQYTLNLSYPVTQFDDPNFFEKVFSSVSKTRKIVFSYGDMSMPKYIYREEEAMITKVSSSFNLQGGVINYVVNAVSSAALNAGQSFTFQGGYKKPSDEIKKVFRNSNYGLQKLFTGMNDSNLDTLIDGHDKFVQLEAKRNISALDYIMYLTSCMIPDSWKKDETTETDIFVLTIHDDTSLDEDYRDEVVKSGSYFKVERMTYKTNRSDAYQIDIGFGNTGTIVTNFSITDDQNYSLLYQYGEDLNISQYVERIDSNGNLVTVWSPQMLSKNQQSRVKSSDVTWWTRVTQFPIKGTITVQGLLRPAILMNYIRLNVIFPGGHKHISSGLYLVTSQKDTINGTSGYKTTLGITKISGDDSPYIN